jgi:lipopolysaccharide export system permease protein
MTMFALRLLPRTYSTWIALQIALRFVLLVLLIEAIFLLQHFFDIFEAVVEEADSFSNVLGLVLLTSPEVYFALPVAVVASVFLVLRECQERRELLVLASAGFGTRRLLLLAALVGVSAQLASLIISGYILPYSSFAFRSKLMGVREQALDVGGAPGRFYSFSGQTIMRWPAAVAHQKTALFLAQNLDNAMQRIITARDARLMDVTDRQRVGILLSGVVAFDFPKRLTSTQVPSDQLCQGCGASTANAFRNSMAIETYERVIDLSELFRLDPRGLTPREWTLGELLGISASPTASMQSIEEGDELITRLVRSLTCLVAPFVALLALTFRGRFAPAVALPAACVTILCVDVGSLMIGRPLVPVGIAVACAALFLIHACLVVGLAWQIGLRHLAITSPSDRKA